MLRLLALLLAMAAAAPAGAAAHGPVCADYKTQADAQRAADTKDADSDGIYCEALPCPCLDPAEEHVGSGTVPARPARPHVGRTVTLANVRRHRACRVRHTRPDRRCTPGAYYAKAGVKMICAAGYAGRIRHVPKSTKVAVYRAYRVGSRARSSHRIDHLVPLELGGSNSRANLFPEAVKRSRRKDRLEAELHERVCGGRMPLRRAQRLIARDWVRAYKRYVD